MHTTCLGRRVRTALEYQADIAMKILYDYDSMAGSCLSTPEVEVKTIIQGSAMGEEEAKLVVAYLYGRGHVRMNEKMTIVRLTDAGVTFVAENIDRESRT